MSILCPRHTPKEGCGGEDEALKITLHNTKSGDARRETLLEQVRYAAVLLQPGPPWAADFRWSSCCTPRPPQAPNLLNEACLE